MRVQPITSWPLIAVMLAGCAGPPPDPTGVGEAGMGLPQQQRGELYPGLRREVVGTVDVTDLGCANVVIDGVSHFTIWPAGSALADPVRLPSGATLAPGDVVMGTGALTPAAPLTADPAGYWANTIGFCAPDAEAVLVLDEVREAAP